MDTGSVSHGTYVLICVSNNGLGRFLVRVLNIRHDEKFKFRYSTVEIESISQ